MVGYTSAILENVLLIIRTVCPLRSGGCLLKIFVNELIVQSQEGTTALGPWRNHPASLRDFLASPANYLIFTYFVDFNLNTVTSLVFWRCYPSVSTDNVRWVGQNGWRESLWEGKLSMPTSIYVECICFRSYNTKLEQNGAIMTWTCLLLCVWCLIICRTV